MSSTKRTSLALKDSSSLPSTSFQRHSASNTLSSWLRHLHPGQSLSDLLSAVFWRDVAVEFLVCMVVECCVVWVLTTLRLDMYQPSTTHIGLFAAFLVFAVVEGYGPVSGAPVNPACCWGFFLARRMSAARMLLYTGVETAGSAAGATIAFSLNPSDGNITVPTLTLTPGLTAVQGTCIEAILTFNLLFVALSVTSPRAKTDSVSPSFPIAFCLACGILAAGTHTGGLQNPMIPFGTAFINNDWTNHWLYWVGPYIGSTVASVVYQFCDFVKDYSNHRRSQADDTELQSPPQTDDEVDS